MVDGAGKGINCGDLRGGGSVKIRNPNFEIRNKLERMEIEKTEGRVVLLEAPAKMVG